MTARSTPWPVAVHDLYDGTAHCVECEGPCDLAPAEFHLSQIIRYTLEYCAIQGHQPNMLLRGAIKEAGADFERHWKRAQRITRPMK